MPRNTREQRVQVALMRARDHVLSPLVELLKEHGLTEPQFNVLRILRGASGGGLTNGGIAERLVNRLPDVTRLVDRLAEAGLVDRARAVDGDRRCVTITITRAGRAKLTPLDTPVARMQRGLFRRLGRVELDQLEFPSVNTITGSTWDSAACA